MANPGPSRHEEGGGGWIVENYPLGTLPGNRRFAGETSQHNNASMSRSCIALPASDITIEPPRGCSWLYKVAVFSPRVAINVVRLFETFDRIAHAHRCIVQITLARSNSDSEESDYASDSDVKSRWSQRRCDRVQGRTPVELERAAIFVVATTTRSDGTFGTQRREMYFPCKWKRTVLRLVSLHKLFWNVYTGLGSG